MTTVAASSLTPVQGKNQYAAWGITYLSVGYVASRCLLMLNSQISCAVANNNSSFSPKLDGHSWACELRPAGFLEQASITVFWPIPFALTNPFTFITFLIGAAFIVWHIHYAYRKMELRISRAEVGQREYSTRWEQEVGNSRALKAQLADARGEAERLNSDLSEARERIQMLTFERDEAGERAAPPARRQNVPDIEILPSERGHGAASDIADIYGAE